MACPAFRPHFFGACPKKRCRAAKEKRLFYLGGSTIRVSATASVVFTHLRPTWGGDWWLTGRSGQLDAVGCDVGASSSWERRVGPNSCRGGTQARFFGAPPRFFAQEQRNGVESAVGGIDFYPRRRRTRSRAQMRCCLVFALCVCADTLGGGDGLPCLSTPFLWCLPKETVSSRQRKAPFLPWWLHHPRERYCLGCLYSSSPDLGRAWWLLGVGGRKKAGGKDRRLPRRCRGDPIITCTSPAGGSPLLCFHASNFQHPARGGSREACNSRRNVASLISNVGLKGP